MKTFGFFLFIILHPLLVSANEDQWKPVRTFERWTIEAKKGSDGVSVDCIGINFDDRILDNGNSLYFKVTRPSRSLYISQIQLAFDDELPMPFRKPSEGEVLSSSVILRGAEIDKAKSAKKLTITTGFAAAMSALDRNVDLKGVAEAIAFIKYECVNSR